MGSIGRRLRRLERELAAIEDACAWCEQAYWTLVSTNDAIGPYSKTEYGNEAGLAYSSTLQTLTGRAEPDYDPRRLRADELDWVHKGFIEAWQLVEESRPPRDGCECFETRLVLRDIEARVLAHYPRVAAAAAELLENYAASPPETRVLYHYGGEKGECACTPTPRYLVASQRR
jgi:hypothetical protein